jgi:hypothetical protein
MSGTKKSKKKWIYIGIGLAIFTLTVAGAGFWFWNKSKNSNESDSTDEKDENEDIPDDIKEWRKKDWLDKEANISNYQIPPLKGKVSEKRAKEELIEAIWHWGGRLWDKKKIERTLEKNSKRINLADIKINDNDSHVRQGVNFLENSGDKYQEDIFFNRPDQNKFESNIHENEMSLFFLIYSSTLKYKNNREID